MKMADVMTLYRPVGPEELTLIKESMMTRFPPRLQHQPFFYPVMTREYAVRIARDWNVKESGAGFVLAFKVPASILHRWPVHEVGGHQFRELWVPAEELDEFNASLIGNIELVESFYV